MALPAVETPAVRLVADTRDGLGEGVLWDTDTGALWWLDIGPQGRIHRLHVASGAHQTWGPFAFATAIALRRGGGLTVATLAGVGHFSEETGVIDIEIEVEDPGNGNRPNDGAADPSGRFWVGTMQQNIGPDGAGLPITRSSGNLWCIGLDRSVNLMIEGLGVTNSPIWSPDGRRFYVADSLAKVIYAYDYESTTADISNRRVLSDEASLGSPDGSAMDEDGCLWNARWDAGVIARITAAGVIDRIVKVPVSRPTCCIFGGPERRTLYITSARGGLSAAEIATQPWAGGLLAIETDVAGLPRHRTVG